MTDCAKEALCSCFFSKETGFRMLIDFYDLHANEKIGSYWTTLNGDLKK